MLAVFEAEAALQDACRDTYPSVEDVAAADAEVARCIAAVKAAALALAEAETVAAALKEAKRKVDAANDARDAAKARRQTEINEAVELFTEMSDSVRRDDLRAAQAMKLQLLLENEYEQCCACAAAYLKEKQPSTFYLR